MRPKKQFKKNKNQYKKQIMDQLHLNLDEKSEAMQWANDQANKVGARGHVGTHLDCYTSAPSQSEYNISAIIIDCRENMPNSAIVSDITSLENKALILHTGNLEQNQYGTDKYFKKETFLSEETLNVILTKKPLFIIIDSHGIAEKGKKHISFDTTCEANGCHVIENVDLSSIKNKISTQIKISVNINYPSTGKPCELYQI